MLTPPKTNALYLKSYHHNLETNLNKTTLTEKIAAIVNNSKPGDLLKMTSDGMIVQTAVMNTAEGPKGEKVLTISCPAHDELALHPFALKIKFSERTGGLVGFNDEHLVPIPPLDDLSMEPEGAKAHLEYIASLPTDEGVKVPTDEEFQEVDKAIAPSLKRLKDALDAGKIQRPASAFSVGVQELGITISEEDLIKIVVLYRAFMPKSKSPLDELLDLEIIQVAMRYPHHHD